MRDNQAPSAVKMVARGYYRLPRLVYVPIRWSKRDKDSWNAMEHKNRLQTLNVRAGGLMYKDIVMPINLIYDPSERRGFHFEAFVDEASGCLAVLFINPKAFVGWSRQFQNKAIA
ncbi:MAG: hypothetical protein Q9213_000756, partial [Squamulea squamosa]